MSPCCLDDFYSDDEDDTAELLAELERIKKERAEEKLRKVVFRPFTSLFINLQLSYFDPNLVEAESRIVWLYVLYNLRYVPSGTWWP